MSLLVFASAKGAPGVTTTVLAVAAAWPADRQVLVVECDPDGGDIAAWYRLAPSPGLVECAAHGRQRLTASAVTDHVQRLPTAGRDADRAVEVVVAPPAAEQASAAVAAVAAAGAGQLFAAMDGVDVLVDAGRLRPDAPTLPLAAGAVATVVVVRPEVAQVAHARPRIARLPTSACPLLLAIGDRPYAPRELAEALDVPVVGALADDPRSAAALAGRGGARGVVRRSALLRSAAAVAGRLAAHAAPSSSDDHARLSPMMPAVDSGATS